MKKYLALAAIATPLFLTACGRNNEYPEVISIPNETTLTTEDTILEENITPVNWATSPLINEVLATYGDYTILARDFLYMLRNNMAQEEQFLAMIAQFTGQDPEEAIASHWDEIGEDGYTNLELLRIATMQQTKERASMIIIARESGATYDQELFDLTMQQLDNQVFLMRSEGVPDPEYLFYDLFGITIEDYQHVERDRLTGISFLSRLSEDVIVPESEIITFIAENEENFEEEARAIHVLVETEQEAESILARINAGEDPSELARLYSNDPGSIGRPGEADGFYQFPRGMMVTPFEDFAFDNPAGSTGIVESNFGFHVMYNMGVTNLREISIQVLTENIAIENILSMVEERNIQWVVDENLLSQLQ